MSLRRTTSHNVPLTVENVQSVFEKTSDREKLCCYWLEIPNDKCGDAATAAHYFMHGTGYKRWRWIIWFLDCIGDTALADSLMVHAEPHADPSLTPETMSPVFKAIAGDWENIGGYITTVPGPRAQLLRQQFSPLDQRREAGSYFALYYPYQSSWKDLSVTLYKSNETEALELAKPQLQIVRDGSLTEENIESATAGIPLWSSEDSYECLNMPKEVHKEIAGKYKGEQAKCQLVSTWLGGHPCPTWEHVVDLLKCLEVDGRGRVGAAKEAEEKYLKMSPEKAQRILEDSLQDGSIPQSSLKVLAAGAARSGKTLSKKHIFKIKFDSTVSPSTGVNEAPIHAVRSISCEMIETSLPEWQQLTQQRLLEALALKLQRGFIRGDLASVATKIIEASAQKSPSPMATASFAPLPGHSQAAGDMVRVLCDQEARAMDVQRSESITEPQEMYKLQLILFLDSGGQPQFHEVLPALSHNICLILLFLKLNERLDHPCSTAFTDEEGEWFDEKCPSLLTNEQMLEQFICTMMAKPLARSEGKRPMVVVIGTHYDLIHECNETLAQKNERLANLFLPALEEELIMNGEDIIFPVNAHKPGKHDEEVFDLVRRKIAGVGVALEQTTPLSWFMFQNDLIKYGEEHGKRVVSMDECKAIAGRLKMDRRSLEAALIHFNTLSVFLYTPSVLPGRVFIDPQMPLDIVNICVTFSYKVQCGKVPGLAAKYARFWKEGIINIDMLGEDIFQSCFSEGVFEAKDALELFKSLYIAAPISSELFKSLYIAAPISSTEFIMPCMLQAVSPAEIKAHLPAPSEHVAVLLLYFDKSRIPNGSFSAIHACMRSEYRWTTCRNFKKEPLCLYRNMVKLQHPSKPVQITFVLAQKHFEVHITAQPAELPAVCPEIRDMLLNSIESAARAFRYATTQATVAFLCPCSPQTRHAATPTHDHSHLQCSVTNIISEPLTEKYRLWLGPDTSVRHQSQPAEPAQKQTPTAGNHSNSTGKKAVKQSLPEQSNAAAPVTSRKYPSPPSSPKTLFPDRLQLKPGATPASSRGSTPGSAPTRRFSNRRKLGKAYTMPLESTDYPEKPLQLTMPQTVQERLKNNVRQSADSENTPRKKQSICTGSRAIFGCGGFVVLLLAILIFRYKGSLVSLLMDTNNSQPEAEANVPTVQPSAEHILLDCQMPTMMEMIKFRGKKRIINLPEEIGEEYYSFGIFLLNDKDGHQVRNIQHNHRDDLEEINIEILEQWLRKGGSQVTWRTLIQTLEDMELNRLANEIRDAVQPCSSPQ